MQAGTAKGTGQIGLGRRALGLTVAFTWAVALVPAAASAATISSSTATPLVDNFTDDGVCSLREMVQIANTNSAAVEGDCTVSGTLGDDAITLGAGSYQVNGVGAEDASPDDNAQGDLDIGGLGNLAITGLGASTTTIAETTGMPSTRVMEVTAGDLDLTDLTVTSGVANAPDAINGGGLLFGSPGTLELLRVNFNANATAAGGDGGAISNTAGTTFVRDSDIVGNNASDSGGGIRGFNVSVSEGSLIQNNTGSGGGGGITSNGAFTLTDSTVDNNHVTNAADGGGLLLTAPASTNLTIDRSRIINNDTARNGGGIYATPGIGNILSIEDSLIQDNEAASATGDVAGGGLYVVNGTTTVDRSVVRSNEAKHTGLAAGANGGGIQAGSAGFASTLRITDSAVVANSATTADDVAQASGGGIRDVDGVLELRRSTVSGNFLSGPTTAVGNQFGGGIELGPNQGSLLLLNSTVSDNTAPKLPAVGAGRGGGIWIGDSGALGPTTAQVILSTIAGNTAGDVGGAADPGDAIQLEGGSATVRGSVLQAADGNEACDPTLTSGGRNVTNDSACFAAAMAGDTQGTDPLLGALADNGGPLIGAPGALERLQTRAPQSGSPVIGRVPVAECTNELLAAIGTDERGLVRPQGGACESGAFEVCTTAGGAFPECPPAPPVASTGAQPDCEPLRQRIKKLSKKIKKATDPDKKAKLKKKRKKARQQLAALGCAP